MWFVSRKKYEMVIQKYAELQHNFDTLAQDHRELVDQNNGMKLRVYQLTNQLEQANQLLLSRKVVEDKRHG